MKLITLLSDYIHYNVDELKLKLAIRMADKAHEKTGKRYFVMPDAKDKLIIMHRPSFRRLKHSGRISYAAKVADLKRESFYYTPYSFETKRHESDVTFSKFGYTKTNIAISDFCNIEMESITPSIRESKRAMFHKYMKESRLQRKNEYRLPFLVRLKIRFKLLIIQCKMELQ